MLEELVKVVAWTVAAGVGYLTWRLAQHLIEGPWGHFGGMAFGVVVGFLILRAWHKSSTS